jgi:PhnB protein
MLRRIGLVFAVLLVAVLGFAATRPDTFHVERSTSIMAPPEAIADEVVLMGGDFPPDYDHPRPSGFCVSLHVDDAAEADRIYAALLEGGRVTMPIERTFWAERFGMLVDRFGIPWMVNYEGSVMYDAAAPAPAGEVRRD